jgi:hypothetical protein
MTTPSEKTGHEGTFSSFTVGVAFGVVVALLFGTEEGRKLVKKGIDAIPDKYKTPPVRIPLIPTEETPHHTTSAQSPFEDSFGEAPPPPPPHVRPTRPEPFKPAKY